MVETMGSGVALFDYDGDGDLDVYWVDSGRVPGFEGPPPRPRLLRNDGPGRFIDATETAGLAALGIYGMGATAGDVDNDGDLDLFVTGWGADRLFVNRGDGTFADGTAAAGLSDPLWSASAAFTDADRDGDLDLYVASYVEFTPEKNYFCGDRERNLRVYCPPVPFDPQPDRFYRNRGPDSSGQATFEDRTLEAGIADTTGKGLGVAAADLDGDGWPDLFVANDTTAFFLFRNRGVDAAGQVRFEEVGVVSGVAFEPSGDVQAGMGIGIADADDNGWPDLYVTNFDLETNALYGNLGELVFNDRRYVSGLAEPSLPMVGFGAAFADFDRDGDPDLAVANGHIADNAEQQRSASRYRQPNQLFENLGKGKFAERKDAGLDVVRASRGLAVGDLDGDLDPDLAIANSNDWCEVYENVGAGGRSLVVELRGSASNRWGVGAKVALAAGGRRQAQELIGGGSYLSQSEPALAFGLGERDEVDRLDVAWPSGKRQRFERLPGGRRIAVFEGVTTAPPASP